MKLTSFVQERQLTVALTGEIDHHEAALLRQKIDSLENTLIFVNMALMPLIVILAGIVVAVVRHRRGARR